MKIHLLKSSQTQVQFEKNIFEASQKLVGKYICQKSKVGQKIYLSKVKTCSENVFVKSQNLLGKDKFSFQR